MTIQEGDVVTVHYTGRLDSGEVFDSSRERDPLQFRVGENALIPGFEEAVVGLDVGQSRTVRIDADKAYGPKRPDLVLRLDRELFDADDVEVGQEVALEDEQGRQFPGSVVEFDEKTVTVDMNHPLAGQDLTFDIEVVDVARDA